MVELHSNLFCCYFSVKERLFPALAEQPLLTKLYLAENRLGEYPTPNIFAECVSRLIV